LTEATKRKRLERAAALVRRSQPDVQIILSNTSGLQIHRTVPPSYTMSGAQRWRLSQLSVTQSQNDVELGQPGAWGPIDKAVKKFPK